MNPASSSSDDDGASSSSSSSISAPSKEGTIQTKPRHARSSNDRSAAPSDDDEDESGDEASSDEEDDESGPDSDEHDDDYGDVNDFDDLPTDDSESDDDPSDSDSDNNEKQHSSRSDDSGEDSRGEDNDDEDVISQDDIPLSERIASKAGLGRRYYTGDDTTLRDNTHDAGGKQQKVERKQRAIELASERLREVRKGQRKDHHSNQSSSGDDNDDDDGDSSIERTPSNKNNPTTKNKKSKHAPTEMSSKRHDYFSRGRPDLNSSGIGISIGANKYKARDPRMISLSGHLDADAFEKRYDFLDEIQEKEIESLKSRVKAWKTSGKKGQRARRKLGLTSGGNASSLEEDQEELTRLLQERAERQRANVVRAAKRSVKSKLRNEVASGTRGAYYPKRSELKKMEAEAKFDEIRKRGGNEAVDAAIAKRRKKNVAKEARSMPSHMIS